MKRLAQDAVKFVYDVRRRFKDEPYKFDEFTELLEDIHTRKFLKQNYSYQISKLKQILCNDRHQDLLLGLNHFLPKEYKTPALKIQQFESDIIHEDGPPRKKMRTDKYYFLSYKYPSELFNKIRDRCTEKSDVDFRVLRKFINVVVLYNKKKIDFHEADAIFRELFRDDPDLYVEWTRVVADTLEESSDDEKSDLGFEFLKRGEKKNGNNVAGNKLSLYKEAMQLKESYLYETDMLFERIRSVTEKLERNEWKLDEPFTVHDLKYIKRLYHSEDNYESGEMVVKSLQNRYIVSRPIVLRRLRQKKMQLVEEKLHTMKVWEEIFEDIREKENVYRHRKFLEKMKKLSSGNGKYIVLRAES